MLLSQFRERGVDWDVLTVSPSEIDRRTWLRTEKFQGPVSAGGSGPAAFTRSFVPEVGQRVYYFGTGHRSAVLTASTQVKRAISAWKKVRAWGVCVCVCVFPVVVGACVLFWLGLCLPIVREIDCPVRPLCLCAVARLPPPS